MRTRLTAASLPLAGVAALAATFVAAGPAAARTVPSCGNHSLTVTRSHTQGATGHSNVLIYFRNTSHSTCSLRGYPGLDALRANGTVLKHAKRTVNGFTGGSRHGIPTVVLRPGAYASADVEWMNFNPVTGGGCAASASIATTPANTSHTKHFKVSVTRCGLQVHPTVAGRSGNA